MRVGLNPYGVAYFVGLQGSGTPRANPRARGLEGFLALAEELAAEVVEIYDPWLAALSDASLVALRRRLEARDAVAVISAGLDPAGSIDSAFRSARLLGAATIRLRLSPVLSGGRGALGERWGEIDRRVRDVLGEWGPRAEAEGRWLAIENHQDFTSDELAGLCEAFRGVGITFDAGNSFAVGEAPLDFARRVGGHVRHLHLKDYRVQFTAEGLRLVRCAIGDGAVPLRELAAIIAAAAPGATAVLEPGALEARDVRLFTPGWWNGYPARSAAGLAACLAAAQVNCLPKAADVRTPWERGEDGEIEGFELAMIRRSAQNMAWLGDGTGGGADG